MVRAIQLDHVVGMRYEVQPVLRQQWKDRIEPLLQMALGVDQSVHGRRVLRRALAAMQRFPARLALDLADLVANLPSAAVERFGWRRIVGRALAPQVFDRALHGGGGVLYRRRQLGWNQAGGDAFAQRFL